MTLFTIITGLAGIISLFLPFMQDLKKWKNYFYYFSFFSLGITAGIIATMSEKAINSFTGDQLLQLLLFVSILSVASFAAYTLIKKEKEMLGYMVLLLVLGIYLPLNLDKIKPKKEYFDKQDLLLLSKEYQDKGNYQKSADYLREYKNVVQETLNDNQKLKIQRKIDYLDSMQITSIR
jgi:hypothetical protein